MSVGAALGVLSGDLINPAAAGPRALTVDDLMPILSDIQYRFSVVADALGAADQSARNSVTAATDAATQAEVIGQDVKDITEHTYTIVIPHSLSWLAGYLVSHFITPILERLNKDESDIRFLLGWRGQIDVWRHRFVDPNVERWVGFHDWFVTWPQSILFRWKEYFDHPDEFGAWAAAPITGPLVAYLAAPEHKTTRDNLTRIIAQAWSEGSAVVFDDMLTFLLSDT